MKDIDLGSRVTVEVEMRVTGLLQGADGQPDEMVLQRCPGDFALFRPLPPGHRAKRYYWVTADGEEVRTTSRRRP